MKYLKEGLILRSISPGYEGRVWKIVERGWAVKGQSCVVQNDVKGMESRPSKTVVEYLIKLNVDGEVSFPTIREVAQILQGTSAGELDINGEIKSLDEWRENKNDTIALMKSLVTWEQ